MRLGLIVVVIALLSPVAAPAIGAEVHLEVEAPPPAGWSAELHSRMGDDLVGWGVASASLGALQVGLWTAIPFRARWSGDLALGNALLLAPVLAGAIATAGIRRSLRAGPSLEGFRQRLKVPQVVFMVAALAAWTPLGVLAGVSMVFAPAAGFAILAVPMSLTVLIGVFAGYRQAAKVTARGGRLARRPPPRLLAAGPTGLVVAF